MYSTTQKQRQPYSRLTGEIGGLDRPAQGILRRGRITLRCRHARMPQQPLNGEKIPLGRIRGRREPMPQCVEGPLIPQDDGRELRDMCPRKMPAVLRREAPAAPSATCSDHSSCQPISQRHPTNTTTLPRNHEGYASPVIEHIPTMDSGNLRGPQTSACPQAQDEPGAPISDRNGLMQYIEWHRTRSARTPRHHG